MNAKMRSEDGQNTTKHKRLVGLEGATKAFRLNLSQEANLLEEAKARVDRLRGSIPQTTLSDNNWCKSIGSFFMKCGGGLVAAAQTAKIAMHAVGNPLIVPPTGQEVDQLIAGFNGCTSRKMLENGTYIPTVSSEVVSYKGISLPWGLCQYNSMQVLSDMFDGRHGLHILNYPLSTIAIIESVELLGLGSTVLGGICTLWDKYKLWKKTEDQVRREQIIDAFKDLEQLYRITGEAYIVAQKNTDPYAVQCARCLLKKLFTKIKVLINTISQSGCNYSVNLIPS